MQDNQSLETLRVSFELSVCYYLSQFTYSDSQYVLKNCVVLWEERCDKISIAMLLAQLCMSIAQTTSTATVGK